MRNLRSSNTEDKHVFETMVDSPHYNDSYCLKEARMCTYLCEPLGSTQKENNVDHDILFKGIPIELY